MNDERMRREVGSWLQDGDPEPPDARQSVQHAMERMPQVRQRSRWWPFPVLYRRTQTPTAADTTHYQPSPNRASNGHTPTVIGRTTSMLSPVKAITTGALVFAIGGVMLVAQPFQLPNSVPGAEVVLPASTSFTGTGTYVDTISEGTQSVTPGGLDQQTSWVSLVRFISSDPRLTGDATVTSNWLVDAREGSSSLQSGTYELANDGGSWLGETTGFNSAELGSSPSTAILVGQDGYEGLTAYVLFYGNQDFGSEFSGIIFPSSMPEVPEPYAAE